MLYYSVSCPSLQFKSVHMALVTRGMVRSVGNQSSLPSGLAIIADCSTKSVKYLYIHLYSPQWPRIALCVMYTLAFGSYQSLNIQIKKKLRS